MRDPINYLWIPISNFFSSQVGLGGRTQVGPESHLDLGHFIVNQSFTFTETLSITYRHVSGFLYFRVSFVVPSIFKTFAILIYKGCYSKTKCG